MAPEAVAMSSLCNFSGNNSVGGSSTRPPVRPSLLSSGNSLRRCQYNRTMMSLFFGTQGLMRISKMLGGFGKRNFSVIAMAAGPKVKFYK